MMAAYCSKCGISVLFTFNGECSNCQYIKVPIKIPDIIRYEEIDTIIGKIDYLGSNFNILLGDDDE